MSFAKNIGKNKNKNLGSKYSQIHLGDAKESSTNALKTASKKATEKTKQATDDSIGNKIADKITRVSKTSPQNNSEENEEEILRGRYISLEERQ